MIFGVCEVRVMENFKEQYGVGYEGLWNFARAWGRSVAVAYAGEFGLSKRQAYYELYGE